MRNLTLLYIIPVFFCIITDFSSCKEFIEPSIAKKEVQLQAPADKYQSIKYNVNFWWDDVEDALSYRLQIVTPGFDSIGMLVLDTLIKNNKFETNLDPGSYQWRIRAENGSSQTGYSKARSFNVESSSLTNQILTLVSPANNTSTSQTSVIFKWNNLYGATKYRIEIDTNNFVNENALVLNLVTPALQLNLNFSQTQVYGWRVRAENETEQSKWSAINYISYNIPPPAQVSLISPLNGSTITLPSELTWNAITGITSFKLYVYKSDSTSLYNTDFPKLLNSNNYSFNAGITGETIYWKVSALNAPGIEGKASLTRKFTIQ